MERVRPHRLLRALVLMIIGPALGALSVAAAYNVGGAGWLLYLAFVVAWAALSYRLIRLPGRPRWKAWAGAVGSIVWTWTALWLFLLLAVAAGPD